VVKRLAVMLAAVVLLGLFGCSRAKPEESTTATSTTVTSESVTETTKVDLQGYEFTWVSSFRSHIALYFSDPENADEQAVMDVCGELEEEYNFTFSNRYIDYLEIDKELIIAGKAGTKSGDFILGYEDMWGEALLRGYLRRLDTDEVRACGMDVLDESQFDTYLTEAAQLGGQVFVTSISGEYTDMQLGYFYAFNKQLVENAGYPAEVIYQAVRDGVWTWDVYIDICKAGAVYDEESGTYTVWGSPGYRAVDVINTMCEGIVIYQDGKYVSNLSDISYNLAVSTLLGRLLGDPAVYQYKWTGAVSANVKFRSQEAIFGMFDTVYDTKSYAAFEYGVVPLPRGGAVKEYTSLLPGCIGYCLQTANGDWEKSCFIFGKLGEALNDTEAAVERFSALLPDAESLEMMREYILPNMRAEHMYLTQEMTDMWYASYMEVSESYKNGAGLGESIAGAAEYAEAFDAAVAEAFRGVNK
jgi:hypothetical protein